MPVYEYQCNDCTKKFELFVPHRMSTDGIVCRDCHSSKVRKLVSSFASTGNDVNQSLGASQPAGGGCCGGAGGCACGH